MKSGNWVSIGGSIRGATHIKQDKPCQDALRIKNDRDGRYYLACLADGHGSDRCPYSDEGAQAAVQVAEALLMRILDTSNAAEAFATLDANKEIWLPKQLETQWKKYVREIHQQKERPVETPFPYYLYGTTLAVLAATDDFVFALQIGDGDILVVDGNASARWLIEPEYSEGNETASLCLPNCWQYVRACIVPLPKDEDGPLMFMLSTDGYANSFSEPLGFTKAGADIFKLWRDNGAAYINEHLEDWLSHSSADGSGDDITMALVLGEP